MTETEAETSGTEEEQENQQGFSRAQFSSVAPSCPTLCDPMNRSPPGLPPSPSPSPGVHSDSRPLSQ